MTVPAARLLQLLQLADSNLPIGATAHSYGLETLAEDETTTVGQLEQFLTGYLVETGSQEAAFCRASYHAGERWNTQPVACADTWVTLNRYLSALKPARESRVASSTLGRRLLQLVAGFGASPVPGLALQAARGQDTECHHCAAFGLVAGAQRLSPETAAVTYLQQSLTGLISACQRLLPLGQQRAARLLWDLQPAVLAASERYDGADLEEICCFTPMLDLGGMRHPSLNTRLFIS